MDRKTITLKELMREVIKRWFLCGGVAIVAFLYMFGSNYYMYHNAEHNALYVSKIEISIEKAKTADLTGVAESVVESKDFLQYVQMHRGFTFEDRFIEDIVYGQSYSDDSGMEVYIVRLLLASPDIQVIEDFTTAIETDGVQFFEKGYGSPVSIKHGETSRIVTGKNGNTNLAAPYELYVRTHGPSSHNIVVWAVSSAMIGLCTVAMWILFKDSIVKETNE